MRNRHRNSNSRLADASGPRLGSGRLALAVLALLAAAPAARAQVAEYYHLDGLGSVRVVSRQDGTIAERHDYLPFGEECTLGPCANNPSVGDGQPRKFTGKERDTETGLDYFGARYYGSRIGRFTTVDPAMTLLENTLDPQRWNRYAYALNNPARFIDPDGRDVSIGLTFTGEGWTTQDKDSIISQVASWYNAQGVGDVYVFDSATKEHGASFASFRAGYVDIEVTSGSSDKHLRDKVFAGNYASLSRDERVTATANSVVHETVAHQFSATYGGMVDQLAYSRGAEVAGSDPQVTRRYGTVADSYAYGDKKTRSKVTGGPIPIDPDDRRKLVDRVGPHVNVKPPEQK